MLLLIPIVVAVNVTRKKRLCPHCGSPSMKIVYDDSDLAIIGMTSPGATPYKRVQHTFRCESCGFSKTEFKV